MNDSERISKMIEQQKELLAKAEAKMGEVPAENLKTQNISLDLIRKELAYFEQRLAELG
ncbi:hypothetical protein [Anoxybacterium hadale]|uniref:hypothetical protein n=1 Tax=Anoxybacterium hadale TaxID=3408580 RepID=UPI003B00E4DA